MRKTMKHIAAALLCMLLLPLTLAAQTNKTIKELEKQREQLYGQIEENKSLLNTTKKNAENQMSQLAVISAQIEERKKYINKLNKDITAVDKEMTIVEKQLRQLEKELKDTKEKYKTSVKQIRKKNKIQDKLLFIFSADNLAQMYRRMRYLNEYATYQEIQGKKIIRKQDETKKKKQELVSVKEEKTKLLSEREAEKEKLEQQEKDQQSIINGLKKKQKQLQKIIRKKQKEASSLNNKIDRLIQIEIEKAKKRAEEEARKAREAAKKENAGKKEKAEKMPAYNAAKADMALSGDFEKNKGILPVPITGSYLIVSHYGQYNVTGLKGVKLDNKGIDIQGKPGAKAKAIFNGEVSAIFEHMGLKGIIIRHGKYISVYYKLSAVSVNKGDKVKTGQQLGTIYTDKENGNATILHFQLRNEKAKLNPELWLDK